MTVTLSNNPEVEFRHAIVKLGIEPKCFGKEVYYVDCKTLPSRAKAKELCSGCPLLELCDAAATRRRPAWGVWGGKVYGALKKKLDT